MDSTLLALFNIVILDLVLSGDNAVVIGMAVRKLPPRQKRVAIIVGGGLALALRATLTAIATFLLAIPLLQFIGGVVLAWITYQLLAQDEGGDTAHQSEEMGFRAAIRTIIIADVTMSIDNVLAVGAAAHGDVTLLLFGLLLSMAILVMGGTIVSVLLEKFVWLKYVGAGVLVYLTGDMIAHDHFLLEQGIVPDEPWVSWVISAVVGLLIAAALYFRRARNLRIKQAQELVAIQSARGSGHATDSRPLPELALQDEDTVASGDISRSQGL
jgi:YjbE family integral membrane protein